MRTALCRILIACVLLVGCGRRPMPPPPPPPPPRPTTALPPPRPGPAAGNPKASEGPLAKRVAFAFRRVPLPEVIGRVARQTDATLGVWPSIPVAEWAGHQVTLTMRGVTLRAFLDWLVRPLRAEYVVEADGTVWITRGDEMLLTDPVLARTYRVPPHLRGGRPRRGALDYAREQRLVLATLEACLGYLLRRRPECRVAFHGDLDVLAATLPERGHARLRQVLDAMRHGTPRRPAPRPSRIELEAKLAKRIACDWDPTPLDEMLDAVAERAGVTIGWDGVRVGSPRVFLPRGTFTVGQALKLLAGQSRLSRVVAEAGHGLWFYAEGQRVSLPTSGATLWDRMEVRAYDVSRQLRRQSPAAIVAALQKRVDPGKWEGGLPAASVFAPTARLLVVHDADGHRRVAEEYALSRPRPIRLPIPPEKGAASKGGAP